MNLGLNQCNNWKNYRALFYRHFYIFNGNMKKNCQIVIIFDVNILTQLAIKFKLLFNFPPCPTSAFPIPEENRTNEILQFYPEHLIKKTHKKRILSTFLSLWPTVHSVVHFQLLTAKIFKTFARYSKTSTHLLISVSII